MMFQSCSPCFYIWLRYEKEICSYTEIGESWKERLEIMKYKTEAEKILKKCNSVEAFENLAEGERQILDNEINGRELLDDTNGFLGRTDRVKLFTFNLPRAITCSGKTAICAAHCYQEAPENMHKAKDRDSAVVQHRKKNLYQSTKDDFVKKMVKEIAKKRPQKNQKVYIRIHSSGDFYSEEYLIKWLKIALIAKLEGKDYMFVAYTKSFEILKVLFNDQEKLHKILGQISNEKYEKNLTDLISKEKLLPEDFNLHIIASTMDDTEKGQRDIAENLNLPIYHVTKRENRILEACDKKTCAECLKCYRFPMDDIATRLR